MLEEKEKKESEMSQKLKLLRKDQEKDKVKLHEANDKINRYLQKLATLKLHPIDGWSCFSGFCKLNELWFTFGMC